MGKSQGFVCAGWDRSSLVRCPRAFRLRLAQNVFPVCSLPKVYFYRRGVSFFGAMHVFHGRREPLEGPSMTILREFHSALLEVLL